MELINFVNLAQSSDGSSDFVQKTSGILPFFLAFVKALL